MINKVLKDIDVSSGAGRVYKKLVELEKSSARQLAESLSLPRTSVYDYLSELEKKGLVVEHEEDSKKIFSIDNPKHIQTLLDEKIESLREDKQILKEELSKISKGGKGVEPKVRIYPGKDSFRRVLNDILWQKKIEILVMWPYGEMSKVIGESYLKNFTKRRQDAGISVRSIWARGSDTFVERIPKEKTRVAPPKVEWGMGYIVYGDNVAFISSHTESFAFIVHSKDFANLQRVQFEMVWKNSKTAKLK